MLRLPSFKERPVINSAYLPTPTYPEPRTFDLNTLMYWIKRTPECIGILKRIATDIVTPLSFVSVASQKTGRPNKTLKQDVEDRAYYFARKNMLRQKLFALVIDWLATGDFYLWKGRLADSQIKEVAYRRFKEYGIELKEGIELKQFFDEDYNGINSIEIIPSSMMKILHDNFKITKYVQKSKTNPTDRFFNPDEIIHGKFIEIDGSVYGYSPMEASYTAIRTVNAIQDYNWYYFENGAKIDRVWKFMGNPNPEALKKFKEDIKQYISIKKAHGHLIISGADKIESETLNEISEEMEYRALAIHSIGRLAFAFNMAADTLSPILGKDIRQAAGSTDVEDAGYNRNIERAQEYLEDLINTQLCIPFLKVEMQLERTFRQDQIRQIQYMAMTVPVIEFMFKHELPVSDEYIINMLQIPRKYLEEGKIKREIEEIKKFQIDNKQSNDKLLKGNSSQAYQEQKKTEQRPQQENNPPIGS